MNAYPCPSCSSQVLDANSVRCRSCDANLVVAGAYRLTGLFGRGGMGRVYSAVFLGPDDGASIAAGTVVAAKVIALDELTDWKAFDLFERGTKVQQGLRHPGVPKVFAADHDSDGRLWLVREAFDGGTLFERIHTQERRLGPQEFKQLLRAGLELMAYLHELSPPVLHRDIKPQNVMFRTHDDWEPVLVDFDTVAAPKGKGSGVTVVGTPGYAAPEQFAGAYSAASDLYGLGATMLFVATGREPDELPRDDGRFDVEHLLDAHEPAVREVLTKMVEVERSARYASARKALEDLDVLRHAAASVLARVRQPATTLCPACCSEVSGQVAFCPNCGAVANALVPTGYNMVPVRSRRWGVTLMLTLFLGFYGVHRFYTGHIALGLVQLFTFGGCGLLWLTDVVLVATKQFRDSDGNRLT